MSSSASFCFHDSLTNIILLFEEFRSFCTVDAVSFRENLSRQVH